MKVRLNKSIEILEAVQWRGTKASWDEIMALEIHDWKPGDIGSYTFYIKALGEYTLVSKGDWIIRDTFGCYVCKEDRFYKLYTQVEG